MRNELELRRVVLLARSLGQGGAERQLILLAKGLARRGIDVSMFLFYDDHGSGVEQLPADVELLCLEKAGRWDLLPFAARLVSEIRRRKPQLVYSFLEVPNLVVAAIKPMIDPARVIWGVRSSNIDSSKYGLTHHAAFFAQSYFSRFIDLVVFNSRAGLASARARGFELNRHAVVPNGIDTNRFRPDQARRAAIREEWGLDSEVRVVGIVARLDPVKDHETFLRACDVVRRERRNVRFVAIGEGDSGRREELRRLAAELGLAESIRWLGGRNDVEHLLPALDLLVLSSSSEGFPNALGEAMACGVPAVSTDVGAAFEVIGDRDVIVPVRDHSALGLAICRRLDRKVDADGLRKRIEAHFSVDRMIDGTLRAFAGIPGIEGRP